MEEVKILQLNMHRAKTADALLPQIVLEQKADIAVISEQYNKKTSGFWIEDDSTTAAIWIPTPRVNQIKGHGKGNCFVWVQLQDITIMSCYLTPSDTIDIFETKLYDIEDKIRDIAGRIIVAGDFNSQAVEWGMRTTNSRGRRIMDMAARTGMIVANEGNTTTFRRPGCEGTIPDITLVSEVYAGKIRNWKVLEIYTGSDHQYISFNLEMVSPHSDKRETKGTHKWKVAKLDKTELIAAIDGRIDENEMKGDAVNTVKHVMKVIEYGCNMSMPKIMSSKSQKKAVYWWNESIAELRRTCLKCRRKYTRAKRRGTAENEELQYKEARKLLRTAIFESKKKIWEELRNDINENPFGLGYKIAMKKLGANKPPAVMDEKSMKNIVESLFPAHESRTDNKETRSSAPAELFTVEELQEAAHNLKTKKAPGPDGIPAEVLKEIAVQRPGMLLTMFNKCLEEGIFPTVWKRQHLVLISKGKGETTSPSSYRPLCLLDTAGKLLEKLLKPRLTAAINNSGGFSSRQHGFRPKRSTIGALKDVVEVVEAAQKETHYSRPIILLATLDVKNAFNSLRWEDVLKSLREKFNVPQYLLRVIEDYLRERVLLYGTASGPREYKVTSGAAQGSILGPDLWNASYDEILRIEMPADTFLVGYADDIAAVIKVRDTNEAQMKLRQVMIRTKTWLKDHGLELATHKTELLLLTRRHIPLEVDMQVDNITMKTQKSIKYLGVRLDSKSTYSAQIRHASTKAAKTVGQLSRLMANVGGPLPCKRKLLMEACNSILLYGCEIWADTLKVKQRANELLSVQRRSALRITSAYRTVSQAAVLVIAGMIPIDIYAQERRKIWLLNINKPQTCTIEDVKLETVALWQTLWSEAIEGRWTARLIPNIQVWVRRIFGDVDYYLTQILSGHGYFRKYLHTMGKCNSPFCIYEESEVIDDAEHTFFYCTRWEEERDNMKRSLGSVTPENLIEKMISDEKQWKTVAHYCKRILCMKKIDLDSSD